jgi:hypothetical protein
MVANDVRALLVAIEEYPDTKDVSPRLEGTTQAARDFIRWVHEGKGVELNNIWLCGEPSEDVPSQIRRFGTTRGQVRQAIISLCDAGRNQTRQLFIFMSGHGFAYQSANEALLPADIFVCSEYVDSRTGGDACVNISELQQMLAYWLGGTDHFYFVDCCRNRMQQSRIYPANLALSLAAADTGRPFIYTLYSTAPGASASARSGFVKHLLDALRGKGRAKGYTDDNRQMQILFPLVSEYLKNKLGRHQIEARTGGGDGIILALPEIPKNTCLLRIRGAAETDEFTAQLLLRGEHLGTPTVFHGETGSIRAKPDVYTINISHPQVPITQIDPPGGAPLDMYDSCEAKFAFVSTRWRNASEKKMPPRTYIELNLPPNTSVTFRNLNGGQRQTFSGNVHREIDAGSYEMQVFEGKLAIGIQHLRIAAGTTNKPNVLGFARSPARMSILRAAGSDPETRNFHLFPNHGPIADIDMALWLSILGASKLLDQNQQFPAFAQVSLSSFRQTEPGAAVLQVLTAFYKPPQELMVGIHSGAEVSWHRGREIGGLQNVWEVTVPVHHAGSCLVSFRLDEAPITTFMSHTMANAVTLVILSPSDGDEFRRDRSTCELRNQYILPMPSALESGAQRSSDVRFPNDPTTIRDMFYIQTRFCSGRAVASVGEAESVATWQDVLAAKKWVDPITVAILCYEMIRRGQLRELEKQIRSVAESLWRNSKLPDANAILMILGEKPDLITVPLLLDGLLPLSGRTDLLPYSASRLEYDGCWTMWKDVVNETD